VSDNPADLRSHLTYHRAPPGLMERIVAALPEEAAPATPPRTWVRWRWPVLRFGTTGFAGALAGALLVLLLRAPPGIPLMQAVIDHHIASVMGDHLTDVQNSNQHVVKPWLSQHLDVSPPVEDFASQGFPLIGARLDYVDGHPAAAVVYRHDRHIITFFSWSSPGAADQAPWERQEQGFNVIGWRRAGLTCFVVSDMEPALLRQFVHLVRGDK